MPRTRLNQDVVRQLRAFIVGLPPDDDRLPPLRELADRFDVSVPTVRMAQAILLEEGLLAARQGSRVIVTDKGRRRLLGIVSELDLLQPRTSVAFSERVSELRRQMDARGYRSEIYLGETRHGETRLQPTVDRFVADLNAGRLHGAVLVTAPNTRSWQALIDTAPVPLVGARTAFDPHLLSEAAIQAAFAHIFQQGARSVSFLGWIWRSPGEHQRLVDLAAKAGLRCRPEWIWTQGAPDLPGSGWEGFREIWQARPDKPDSILIMDDMLAADATMAILEMGIPVPQQLNVLASGFSDSPTLHAFDYAELRPDMAAHAAHLLDAIERQWAGETPGQAPPVDFTIAPIAKTGPAAARTHTQESKP